MAGEGWGGESQQVRRKVRRKEEGGEREKKFSVSAERGAQLVLPCWRAVEVMVG